MWDVGSRGGVSENFTTERFLKQACESEFPYRFHKVLFLRKNFSRLLLPHRESFVDTWHFKKLLSRYKKAANPLRLSIVLSHHMHRN